MHNIKITEIPRLSVYFHGRQGVFDRKVVPNRNNPGSSGSFYDEYRSILLISSSSPNFGLRIVKSLQSNVI